MSNATTSLPPDVPEAPGEENPSAERARIAERVEALMEQVATLTERVRHGNEEPPPRRKYTYEEAGVRLHFGCDPCDVPRERWAEGLSAKSVRRLTSDGDCPLRAIRVGGKQTVRITEAEIRNFERSVEAGHVDGYQVKRPRKHRK